MKKQDKSSVIKTVLFKIHEFEGYSISSKKGRYVVANRMHKNVHGVFVLD